MGALVWWNQVSIYCFLTSGKPFSANLMLINISFLSLREVKGITFWQCFFHFYKNKYKEKCIYSTPDSLTKSKFRFLSIIDLLIHSIDMLIWTSLTLTHFCSFLQPDNTVDDNWDRIYFLFNLKVIDGLCMSNFKRARAKKNLRYLEIS